MEKYWLFFVPAIFCLLFAGRINALAKKDKRFRAVLLVLLAVLSLSLSCTVLLLSVLLLFK